MTPEEQIQSLQNELKIARELLWAAWSNGMGYGDDGEMQWYCIDFKRMSMQEIRNAIHNRNLDQIRKEQGTRMIERIKLQLDIVNAAMEIRSGNIPLTFFDAVQAYRDFCNG